VIEITPHRELARYPEPVEITLSEEATALALDRGGTLALDFIPPIS
jgi:hypothetical protein